MDISFALLKKVFNWQALISIDPNRAKEDPIIVRNLPFYKAKKALETEVLKLNPPPRPQHWGVCLFFLRTLTTSTSINYYVELVVGIEKWFQS